MRSPPHLAHGLAGDYTSADWPALQPAEIATVARHYPDIAPWRLVWHSPRPLSAAALVESPHGRFFLKRHHRRVRSADTLAEEHRFMAHLRDRGVPVPAVFANTDGHTATALGDWVYELHACAVGIDLYRDSMSWEPITETSHARVAGRMLARLHQAAAGYDAPQRTTHLLVARSELLRAADIVAVLRTQLPQRPGLADYLESRAWQREIADAAAWSEPSRQRLLATLPPLWTHGDWHVSNLCWDHPGAGARITAVLDFGLAAANFALFDLATAIERNAIAWLALQDRPARIPVALALIDGYRDVRTLARGDIELLADLLPRVHLDFALSEVEYFHSITHSRAHADTAYDTFLLGHAAWFRGADGRTLLDAIRGHA